MVGRGVSTHCEVIISGTLVIIGRSLISLTRRLVMIRPRLILIARRLVVIQPRLILIAHRSIALARQPVSGHHGRERGATRPADRDSRRLAAGWTPQDHPLSLLL